MHVLKGEPAENGAEQKGEKPPPLLIFYFVCVYGCVVYVCVRAYECVRMCMSVFFWGFDTASTRAILRLRTFITRPKTTRTNFNTRS